MPTQCHKGDQVLQLVVPAHIEHESLTELTNGFMSTQRSQNGCNLRENTKLKLRFGCPSTRKQRLCFQKMEQNENRFQTKHCHVNVVLVSNTPLFLSSAGLLIVATPLDAVQPLASRPGNTLIGRDDEQRST